MSKTYILLKFWTFLQVEAQQVTFKAPKSTKFAPVFPRCKRETWQVWGSPTSPRCKRWRYTAFMSGFLVSKFGMGVSKYWPFYRGYTIPLLGVILFPRGFPEMPPPPQFRNPACSGTHGPNEAGDTRWAPSPVVNLVISPKIGLEPEWNAYIPPCIGVITPFYNDRRGPPCIQNLPLNRPRLEQYNSCVFRRWNSALGSRKNGGISRIRYASSKGFGRNIEQRRAGTARFLWKLLFFKIRFLLYCELQHLVFARSKQWLLPCPVNNGILPVLSDW